MVTEYDVQDVRRSGTYADVSVDLLKEIPLPPAGKRTRWFGVQHAELVASLAEGIRNAGVKYDKDTWTLSGKGERLYGYIDVSLSEEEFEWTKKALDLPDEITYKSFAFNDIELRLGLRHSNDSTVALYIMVIPRMKEHGNAFTVDGGNISLVRRHTHTIGDTEDGLDNAVKEGVKTFLLKAATIEQEIRMMKAIALTSRSAHHIMVTAAAKKIIPWSSIGKVWKVWSEEEGSNAWDLYQAITRAGKDYNLVREMGIVTQSRKLILELCDEAEDEIEAEGLEEVLDEVAEAVLGDEDTGQAQLLQDGHYTPIDEEVPEEDGRGIKIPHPIQTLKDAKRDLGPEPMRVQPEKIKDIKPAPTRRAPNWDTADIF